MDTMIAAPERQLLRPLGGELLLVWQGREFRLPADCDATLSIGLHRKNDLVVHGTYLSKHHATLHWRRNRYELVDHSTNGTFVQLEDERISHVHRSVARLWGTGFLSFGEPLAANSAIQFTHA